MTLDNFLKSAGNNGFLTIESTASQLGYIIDPTDRERIMLATEHGGGIILTRKQLRAISAEATEIMEVFA